MPLQLRQDKTHHLGQSREHSRQASDGIASWPAPAPARPGQRPAEPTTPQPPLPAPLHACVRHPHQAPAVRSGSFRMWAERLFGEGAVLGASAVPDLIDTT